MKRDRYEILRCDKIPNTRSKYAEILMYYKPGDIVTIRSIINEHHTKFTGKDEYMSQRVKSVLIHAIEIGLAKKIPRTKHDITHLETVQYWLGYLNGGRYNHSNPANTTRSAYLFMLTQFDEWLQGKTHQIELYDIKTDTQKIVTQRFESVEELLYFTKKPGIDPSNTVRIITKHLQDPMHKDKKATSLNITKSAIKSYFGCHDRDLNIKYNPKVNHDTLPAEKSFTLSDLLAMLTSGSPTVTDKAMFMCMFQRGLDISTTIDRFNYDAWEQIVKHFGGADYEMWDMSRCPVPLSLVRVKTNFKHIGYLDRDAISALIPYLKYRYRLTGRQMSSDQPLFITHSKTPIQHSWVHKRFITIGNRAEIIRTKVHGGKNRAGPHEMRDLLKSTLIVAGCRADVADHVIGHKPKDSYEKQHILYPESMRQEFAKASSAINIFTRFRDLTNKGDDVHKIKAELAAKLADIDSLSLEVQRLREREQSRVDKSRDSTQLEISNLRAQVAELADNRDKTDKVNAELLSKLASVDSLSIEVQKLREREQSRRDMTTNVTQSENDTHGDEPSSTSKKLLEFCCVSCELIHDQMVCPRCGSKQSRIYHS